MVPTVGLGAASQESFGKIDSLFEFANPLFQLLEFPETDLQIWCGG